MSLLDILSQLCPLRNFLLWSYVVSRCIGCIYVDVGNNTILIKKKLWRHIMFCRWLESEWDSDAGMPRSRSLSPRWNTASHRRDDRRRRTMTPHSSRCRVQQRRGGRGLWQGGGGEGMWESRGRQAEWLNNKLFCVQKFNHCLCSYCKNGNNSFCDKAVQILKVIAPVAESLDNTAWTG